MKKILLVLGASGLTGSKIMRLAEKRFTAFGTYNTRTSGVDLIKLDMSNFDDIHRIVKEVKPHVVLNTTALHNVDYCENHPEESFTINAKAVGVLADTCNSIGARLINISTDYVFDGTQGNYSESDIPNPISVYGQSKLQGEIETRKCNSYAIIRTSVVYGWTPAEMQATVSSSGKPQNFALWALSKLRKKDEMKVVNDQYTSPTLADILAAVILRIANIEDNEIFHVAGTVSLNRYDFVCKIASIMGYAIDNIKAVSSTSFSQVAKRPRNSSLDSRKVEARLNYRLLNADESLSIMRSQIELEQPDILGS